MIGCNFLLKISKALCKAKHNTSPFGGINIIFAGDFAQLPPVSDPRLFSHIKTAKVDSESGQNAAFGKLLWFSVNTVVVLNEVMRQSGAANLPFVDLLYRLRTGSCNAGDYNLLSSRTLRNANIDWMNPRWQTAPIVVAENKVKDALNIQAADVFARRTGKTLHWYYAVD
ncbi:hypothetical protein K435DRAFT_585015, partial [Dendrothele bispora CBS 962.96]